MDEQAGDGEHAGTGDAGGGAAQEEGQDGEQEQGDIEVADDVGEVGGAVAGGGEGEDLAVTDSFGYAGAKSERGEQAQQEKQKEGSEEGEVRGVVEAQEVVEGGAEEAATDEAAAVTDLGLGERPWAGDADALAEGEAEKKERGGLPEARGVQRIGGCEAGLHGCTSSIRWSLGGVACSAADGQRRLLRMGEVRTDEETGGVGTARRSAKAPSIVEAMSRVWRLPSLTGVEIAWRWLFGGVVLGAVWWRVGADWLRRWDEAGRSVQIWVRGSYVFGFDSKGVARNLGVVSVVSVVSVVAVVWACVWAAGRLVILRRLDPRLRGRWGTLAQLGILRVMSLGVLLVVLWGGVFEVVRVAVIRPMLAQAEPNYVLGFAGVLGVSLVLFVGWSLVSWVLQLAPVLAMAQDLGAVDSVRAALREGPLRLKLVEINLVMWVVKVALIVLAMVLSASPLPFTNVATQGFLTCWWAGAVLLYLAMSDYFHVVRLAAYLALWRTYQPAAVG